jgi:hypothetical protein
LKESYSDFNQFSQAGVGPSSLGLPGYGFAVDPKISINGHQDSPYSDQYTRTPLMVNTLVNIMKDIYKDMPTNYGSIKYDQFLEDVDGLTDFKILRIKENNNMNIDIFISFFFNDEEFFGVYRDFNFIQKQPLMTDFFTDDKYKYIDKEYRLKLDNYFRKILDKWFKPKKDFYTTLKEIFAIDKMGNKVGIPMNKIVEVINSNSDKDGNSFVQFTYKNELYTLTKNDYYYFNYWFEKYEDKMKYLK